MGRGCPRAGIWADDVTQRSCSGVGEGTWLNLPHPLIQLPRTSTTKILDFIERLSPMRFSCFFFLEQDPQHLIFQLDRFHSIFVLPSEYSTRGQIVVELKEGGVTDGSGSSVSVPASQARALTHDTTAITLTCAKSVVTSISVLNGR